MKIFYLEKEIKTLSLSAYIKLQKINFLKLIGYTKQPVNIESGKKR
jgi:hypothetical protein